jgi:hypothetical protein
MAKFFVMHLTEDDQKDRGQPRSDRCFEIQVLDAAGRARICGYVSSKEAELTVGGVHIPSAVIAAAKRQQLGQGDFVDETGQSIGFS